MNYKDVFDSIENILEGEAHLDELASQKQDPFKILISTILSARTRDENTRQATISLFSKFKTPKEIAEADPIDLEKLIFKAGFYRVKAQRIKEVSRKIVEDFNGRVPKIFKDLISLPGVGPKTANCVIVYAFKCPAIPVDTHVHRISNRLQWVQTMKPEQTEEQLKSKIPKDQWIRINRLLVRFGQQICLPNNPKCEKCPIENICPKDFSQELKVKKKKKSR
ncbi:MAG: endonuclease III [Promethearchaeota archaeon]|nr:MAG: endonuclease III [Candidatus Lokiarchaeota archaeon]